MELPIQLKFFQKIDLYQEYKSEERKFRTSGTKLQRWNAEKEILKWTATKHHHLGSTLTNQGIKEEILKNHYSHAHEHAIESLILKEHAYRAKDESGIKISKTGLLMGEVIHEVENEKRILRWSYQLKYQVFFALVWITAITGALIVIINGWRLIHSVLESLFISLMI